MLVKRARKAAAKDLGEPAADTSDPRVRSRLLPALKEFLAADESRDEAMAEAEEDVGGEEPTPPPIPAAEETAATDGEPPSFVTSGPLWTDGERQYQFGQSGNSFFALWRMGTEGEWAPMAKSGAFQRPATARNMLRKEAARRGWTEVVQTEGVQAEGAEAASGEEPPFSMADDARPMDGETVGAFAARMGIEDPEEIAELGLALAGLEEMDESADYGVVREAGEQLDMFSSPPAEAAVAPDVQTSDATVGPPEWSSPSVAAAGEALTSPTLVDKWRRAFEEAGDTVSSLIRKYVANQVGPFVLRGQRIASPADMAALLMPLRSPYFESMKVVYLDSAGRIIESRIVTCGLLDASLFHAREFLRNIPEGTAGVIVAHNHPSGNPTPSADDMSVSRGLVGAFHQGGIPVLDHIITNGGRYFSLREQAMIPFARGLDKRLAPVKGLGRAMPIPPLRDRADWEAVRRDDLQHMRDTARANDVVRALRQANAEYGHIIYLNTINRIVAVERFPLTEDPVRILARATRGAGDQGRGDPWNLMASFYPRTLTLHMESLIDYRLVQKQRRRLRPRDEVLHLAGQHASATASIVCDRIALSVVRALEKVAAMEPVLPRHLQEEVYHWLARMPGLRGKEKALRKELEQLLERKVERGLL
jgi:DNA repair protein RadC